MTKLFVVIFLFGYCRLKCRYATRLIILPHRLIYISEQVSKILRNTDCKELASLYNCVTHQDLRPQAWDGSNTYLIHCQFATDPFECANHTSVSRWMIAELVCLSKRTRRTFSRSIAKIGMNSDPNPHPSMLHISFGSFWVAFTTPRKLF